MPLSNNETSPYDPPGKGTTMAARGSSRIAGADSWLFPLSGKLRVTLPDMEFIRSKIRIADVATGLGLKLSGRNAAHCWRTERHQNGDRTASISFRRNKATCYVCDARPLSTLDLVIAHEGFGLLDATCWICARWNVPNLAKGKKLIRSERWRSGRVGVSHFPFEELIRSGYWASLDDASRAILPALVCFADPSTGEAEISYKALARYSGKRSDTTISAVIKKFERLGLMKVFRANDGTFRKCGRYRLDWGNEHFQSVIASSLETLKVDRDAERSLRAEAKAEALLLKSNTLSSTLERPRDARSSTVECRVSEDRQSNARRETTRSSVLERQVSEVLNAQELNPSVWEPPTFMELRWPLDEKELAALGIWHIPRFSAATQALIARVGHPRMASGC